MIRKRTPFVLLLMTVVLGVFLKNDFIRFLIGFELMLFAAGIVEIMYLSRRISGELWLDQTMVRKNDSFLIKAKVKNKSPLAVPELLVRVAVRAFPDRDEVLMTGKIMLDSGEEGFLVFEMESSYCSCLEIRLERIMVSDHLGLFQKQCAAGWITASKLLFILPVENRKVEADLGLDILPEGEDGSEIHRGQQGEEIIDIRTYREGDMFKMVHWKLSARLNELMVREMGKTGETVYWIYLNLEDALWEEEHSTNRELRRRNRERWDRFFEVVEALTTALLGAGIPYRVVWADYSGGRIEQFSVKDQTERRQMMCALLHTDSFCQGEQSGLLRNLPFSVQYDRNGMNWTSETNSTNEIQSEIIEINLQGDITSRTARR